MSDPNYLNRTNPNLVVILHYLGKTQWVLLAAFFGYIGLSLYSWGISTSGGATASFFGVKFTLEDAGPGLVVMVFSLLCALVGAVRAKVEMTEGSIKIAAPPEYAKDEASCSSTPKLFEDAKLPVDLSVLEHVWGLTEIAMIRTPVAAWASDPERVAILDIQKQDELPEAWPDRLSEVARNSPGFRTFLKRIQLKQFNELGFKLDEKKYQRILSADFSLPWCVRLRWSAHCSDKVDLFLCATGNAGNVEWYTFGK